MICSVGNEFWVAEVQKTYKGTIGTKEFFIELPESYSGIASDLGFEATTAADFKVGDFVPSHQVLLRNGIIFELSLGLKGKKRGRCVISAEKLANRNDLVGKTFNGKMVNSASIRTYSKLQ